jgi:transglycosylase-like protein
VNPNNPLVASRPKLAAIAVALIALSLTFILASSAPASSGGIGTGTGGNGGKQGTDTPSNLNQSSPKYKRLWHRTPVTEKRWARSTSTCESGNDPDAIGGGGAYRGAFQFTRQTWASSPKSPGGDPTEYDYTTQAVVAVALKKREGTSPWPVCG